MKLLKECLEKARVSERVLCNHKVEDDMWVVRRLIVQPHLQLHAFGDSVVVCETASFDQFDTFGNFLRSFNTGEFLLHPRLFECSMYVRTFLHRSWYPAVKFDQKPHQHYPIASSTAACMAGERTVAQLMVALYYK